MSARAASSFVLLILACNHLLAADRPAATPAPELARGQKMLEAYLKRQTQRISDACLADIKTREDWEKKRPELRRQFFDMMGLWPLPHRTDLKPVITGKIDADKFTVEKLHFQSAPGLYVSANLYVPKEAKFPAPAILYVCGHGGNFIDKVSYGNKVTYQHHAAWFASHGYVCLVVDTLQLGELQGIHHGTHPNTKLNYWWWHTLGYTPAGIECWNGMRALDYLETRKEVDPKRLGVTGRSGGGATSWWVAAADDRVQAIIPVAGIADLYAYVVEGEAPQYRKGVISGHCDCMYFVNTYRWDFAMVAALCAPRPLLLGNSDVDAIFPVGGYRRLADKARKIYELYGASDRFALLETSGPHKDTPELRLGAYRWMNRWLKGDDKGEVTEPERPRFDPKQLKVFERAPDDVINATLHEQFLKPAHIDLPKSPDVTREWWAGRAKELRHDLKANVFHGWTENPPPLNVRPAGDVRSDGLRLRAYDFTSEDEIELRVWLLTSDKLEKPSLAVLTAMDDAGWRDWLSELGPAFKDIGQATHPVVRDDKKFEQTRRVLEKNPWALAAITPRGHGPTRWTEPGTPEDGHIRRRFVLLGQTLDGQRVWDVRRGLAVLRGLPELKGTPLWLQGKNDLAGVVLYAALFEPDVARLDLWHLPASHRQGPILLNVRRHLDSPQALALAFPTPIRLYVKDEQEAKNWAWPLQLQAALGQEYVKIRQVGE